MFDVKYWMKRFLHHYRKHRFIPSLWWCWDCRAKWSGRPHHVQENHYDKEPDHRVFRFDPVPKAPKPEEYRPRAARIRRIPPDIDLRPILKGLYESGVLPYNQGRQGSCTANCGALDRILVALKLGLSFLPSRAYLYIRERLLHGWEDQDNGAYMSDIGTVLGQFGICSEATMKYNENDYRTLPTGAADKEAAQWKFDKQQEALHVDQIPDQLYECQQNPHAGSVRFGIPVYESYMKALYNGGIVPLADPAKEELLGGHAQECLGKLDSMSPGYFIHAQSYGAVGDLTHPPYKGIFYYPYAEARRAEQKGELDARTQQDNQTHPGPEPPHPPKTCFEQYPKDLVRLILCLLGKLKPTAAEKAKVQKLVNDLKKN